MEEIRSLVDALDDPDEAVRSFAKAVLAIRTATAELAERPIPASTPELAAGPVPVPAVAASPTASRAAELPIAGDSPTALDDVRHRLRTWWRRLLQRRG